MGGNTFPTLNVPRIEPEAYIRIRDSCMSVIEQFYHSVIVPAEAPGKKDFGDVDYLVAKPLREFTPDELQTALQAVQRTKNATTTSFAVPHTASSNIYAQVDIHVCDHDYLDWVAWMHGYGDLIQIIGVLNRRVGLIMTDTGLFLIISEIAQVNRRAAMVFLTKDPYEVRDFLGLDEHKYHAGFETVEDMFLWAAKGRFFKGPGHEGEGETSNDRNRARKRPIFKQFLYEWAPTHSDTWDSQEGSSRQDVRTLAMTMFKIEDAYNQIMDTWNIKVKRDHKLQSIKDAIPEENEQRLKEAMRGMRRWTGLDRHGSPCFLPMESPNELDGNQKDWLDQIHEDQMDELLDWVQSNHAELRRREVLRAKAKAEEFLPRTRGSTAAETRTSEAEH
jgi:hypothetical protein